MKNIFIQPSAKIIDAMKLLATVSSGCLIVVRKKRYFLGTLNDGDIRRGILKGFSGKSSIQNIYQRKPIVINEKNFSLTYAKSLMRKSLLPVLPILNNKKLVTNYLTWSNVFGNEKENNSLKNLNFIIMAGGRGTRLAPFTKVLPKPLLPINDKPVIQHIIERFLNYGAKQFFISVNYKSLLLKSFFNELNPSYNLKLLNETEPLGTVGGLYLHKKKLMKNDIFLSNCDILINANFAEMYNFHQKNKSDLTVIVSTKNYEIPYGICHITKNGRLKKIIEKPKSNYFVNTGLYIIKPKILNLIPKNQFFHMNQLIELAIKKKYSVSVYPIRDKDWVDIGEPSTYRLINK